jgi:hypothetical protein
VSWKRRALAVVGAGALVVAAVAMTRPGKEPGAAQAAPEHGRLAPGCSLHAPFTGFAPGSDAGKVARSRGAAPTRLTAHSTVADLALSEVRMEVRDGARVVRAESLGEMRASGQALGIAVGDTDDDGAPIAPGTYDVLLSAKVTGTDECGERATQWVSTRAGVLAVT